jgi:hypothetical protein
MPRKRSGYELVIEYFTSAEPSMALQAMHTAQAIIRGRNLGVDKPRKAASKKKTANQMMLGVEANLDRAEK